MTRSTFRTIAFCILTLTHLQAHAVNPVQGWYAGVFLGPTYTPNIAFNIDAHVAIKARNLPPVQQDILKQSFKTFLSETTGITHLTPDEALDLLNTYQPGAKPGKLKYSVLGGIGGQVGYRFCTKYRAEFEVFYNNNPFSELQIGNITINSVSTNDVFHIGGDTNTGAGLINIFYDFLAPSKDYYGAVAPYIGVGLGYSYVQNSLQFHYGSNRVQVATQGATPATLYEVDFTQAQSTYAGQAIIGLSYFMDDFCWLSADFRYFTTGKTVTNNPFNGAQFESKTELYSAMIGFNGILDFG